MNVGIQDLGMAGAIVAGVVVLLREVKSFINERNGGAPASKAEMCRLSDKVDSHQNQLDELTKLAATQDGKLDTIISFFKGNK